MIKHLPFLDICKDSRPIFAKTFSTKVYGTWVAKDQVPVFPTLALTEYKPLGSTYLNAVPRLVGGMFTKAILLSLCAADSLGFNEGCSIAATDQAQ